MSRVPNPCSRWVPISGTINNDRPAGWFVEAGKLFVVERFMLASCCSCLRSSTGVGYGTVEQILITVVLKLGFYPSQNGEYRH